MADPSARARIVFVDHTAVLGGAELCLLDIVTDHPGSIVCVFEDGPLVAELRARGVRVEVLAAPKAVQTVRRAGGPVAALQSLPGVWRLARSIATFTRPGDLLYANSQKSWIVAALVAWRYRCAVIWHLHDIMSAAHFGRLLARTAIALANRFAAAVIANSAATAQVFVEAGGRRELVRVVHNGIDAAAFRAQPAEMRAALRRELGLDERQFTIGLFGRITPWKGQHVLLEALLDLPDVQVLIVGAPLFGESGYLSELERLARAPGLAGRVRFLGFRSDVAELMQAVDVVAHTSTSPEPFGRVVVEAMLARRPIVATAMGGVLEIVTAAVDGELVPPGNPTALAAAVQRLRRAPAYRERLVENGYAKATRQFTVAAMRSALAVIVADVRRERTGRLVLVSHSAEPSGAELSLVDIATYFGTKAVVYLFQNGPIAEMLRQRGARVEVIAAGPRTLGVRSRAGLLAVAAAVPGVLGLAWALRRALRPYDVLYANSQKAWVVAALAGWWCGRPVVWHLRDILSAARFGAAQRRLAVWLANRVAACVLSNSRATGAAFVASGGRAALLRVVHNGIDAAPFAALRGVDEGRDLGTARSRAVVVGLFGRLARWKGQHVLLAALERVPEIEALIVGDALFGEHEYAAELQRLAASPPLAGRVRFLGHRPDVPRLMRAVDIVVHTSIEPEPFGRVIVEGMLAERPVIATAGGGVAEIVSDGVDGLLVPPGDPEALAAAIRALVDDPRRAQRLAAAAYSKASRQFGLGQMQRQVAAVVTALVPTQQWSGTEASCE